MAAIPRGKVERGVMTVILGINVSAELLYQHTHRLVVAVVRGMVEGGHTIGILDTSVCAEFLHQHAQHLMMPISCHCMR